MRICLRGLTGGLRLQALAYQRCVRNTVSNRTMGDEVCVRMCGALRTSCCRLLFQCFSALRPNRRLLTPGVVIDGRGCFPWPRFDIQLSDARGGQGIGFEPVSLPNSLDGNSRQRAPRTQRSFLWPSQGSFARKETSGRKALSGIGKPRPAIRLIYRCARRRGGQSLNTKGRLGP